jgi:hypothetical protein
LLQVRVQGQGVVCHNGTRSCFTESLSVSAASARTEGSLS